MAFAVWLTGLPASGKSTLAAELSRQLAERNVQNQVLDSDELRAILTPRPTFTDEERNWFYSVMAYIGTMLVHNGVNVIFAGTAHKAKYRNRAGVKIRAFLEVHVKCSSQECMNRDKKEIYERAFKGEANSVPGVQVQYEPPGAGAFSVDTQQYQPTEGAAQIVNELKRRSFIC